MNRIPEADTDQFGRSVVRIRAVDGSTVGVGALVSALHVVTCAHVVNVALGREPHAQDKPTGKVTLDFPLLPGQPNDDYSRRASVEVWIPPPRAGSMPDDIAGLHLDREAPQSALPAEFLLRIPAMDDRMTLFGYPRTRPHGVWSTATMRGTVGNGRLQLDADPDAEWRAQQGFSGGPVFHFPSGRVAGILAETAPLSSAARDGYATTAERLRLSWPDALNPQTRTGPPGPVPPHLRGSTTARSTPASDPPDQGKRAWIRSFLKLIGFVMGGVLALLAVTATYKISLAPGDRIQDFVKSVEGLRGDFDSPRSGSQVPSPLEAAGKIAGSLPYGADPWLLVRPEAVPTVTYDDVTQFGEYVTATDRKLDVDSEWGRWKARVTLGVGPCDENRKYDIVLVVAPSSWGQIAEKMRLRVGGQRSGRLGPALDPEVKVLTRQTVTMTEYRGTRNDCPT